MPMAARITDATTHGAPLSPGPGSNDVLIGNLPAWRTLIDQHACPAVSISGADGVGMVLMGSPTVLIDFQMSCRQLDIVVEVPGLAMGPMNPILMGCPTVIIGEVGMGGMSTPMAQQLVAAKAAGVSVVPVTSSPPPAAAAAAGPSNPPNLDGVTPEDTKLAATPGISAQQVAAREKVAKAFYNQIGGMDDAAAEAHMSGIDMTQPVIADTTPPPESALQWHAPGRVGKYFADPGTKPTDLGIGNFCLDPNTKQMIGKSVDTYAIKPGTAYLQSVAKKVVDTWSVPLNNACPSPLKELGLPQMTKGGGKQYFMAAKDAATKQATSAATNQVNQWMSS